MIEPLFLVLSLASCNTKLQPQSSINTPTPMMALWHSLHYWQNKVDLSMCNAWSHILQSQLRTLHSSQEAWSNIWWISKKLIQNTTNWNGNRQLTKIGYQYSTQMLSSNNTYTNNSTTSRQFVRPFDIVKQLWGCGSSSDSLSVPKPIQNSNSRTTVILRVTMTVEWHIWSARHL